MRPVSPWPPAFASDLRGVESNEPDALAPVVGSDIVSTHHERLHGVADRFHRGEQPVNSASSESRDVLKAAPTRSDLVDKSHGLEEQSGSGAVEALAVDVGGGGVLTRRASEYGIRETAQVISDTLRGEGDDVRIHEGAGIVAPKHLRAPRVVLAGSHRAETRAMEAEGPATRRAAEQVQYRRSAHGRHHVGTVKSTMTPPTMFASQQPSTSR